MALCIALRAIVAGDKQKIKMCDLYNINRIEKKQFEYFWTDLKEQLQQCVSAISSGVQQTVIDEATYK